MIYKLLMKEYPIQNTSQLSFIDALTRIVMFVMDSMELFMKESVLHAIHFMSYQAKHVYLFVGMAFEYQLSNVMTGTR